VPSWADVGYLGAIPLAAAALLCHPGMHTAGSHKTRATLDGLAIGTAVLLLSWTFVLGSLWRHTDLTTAGASSLSLTPSATLSSSSSSSCPSVR